ncbi:MAG: DUF2779 domain-containing protein [Clostridia bacterium]|nr:DUF2779 domain-containing protein [Clostridia bacterium]
MKTYITNEGFREGCRCRRLFWLNMKNHISYADHCPQLTALAQDYIKGGVAVTARDLKERSEETLRFIKNGETVIKRPAFIIGGVCAEADILHIKNGIPTVYFSYAAMHMRRAFCREAGLIYAAAEINGLNTPRILMLLPKKEFERRGNIDPRQLFAVYDLTAEAFSLREKSYIFSRVLEDTLESSCEPDEPIHKNCFNPDTCKYFEHCTAHLPHPNIFKVARLNINTKLQLYKEGKVSYEQLRNEPVLTENQRKQIRMSMDKAAPAVKKKELREFLSSLWYPLCFLDFESWQPPVPPADGMHPFSQVPFQYSLHIIENEGGPVMHREYLARGESDPREELARRLVSDIPEGACVLAYNKQFESMVVSDLAHTFSDIRAPLEAIRDNIRDLMVPFQKKYYYDPKMEGSFSIKAVLPAMYPNDPELSYDNLSEIHNGSQAMLSYSTLADETPERACEIRRCLLRYCELDTLGMVKILEKLREAVK